MFSTRLLKAVVDDDGIHEHIPAYFLGNLSGRSSLIRPP